MDSVSNFRSVSFSEPLPLQRDLALAYDSIERTFSTAPHILEPDYEAFIQEFLREISIYIEGDHQYSPQEQADLYLFVDQLIQHHMAEYQEILDPLVYTQVKEISSHSSPTYSLLLQSQETNSEELLQFEISQNRLLNKFLRDIRVLPKRKKLKHLMNLRRGILFKLSQILIPLILNKISLSKGVRPVICRLYSEDEVLFQFFAKFRNVFTKEDENGPALGILRKSLEEADEKKQLDRLLLWILERTMFWRPDKHQAAKELKFLISAIKLDCPRRLFLDFC